MLDFIRSFIPDHIDKFSFILGFLTSFFMYLGFIVVDNINEIRRKKHDGIGDSKNT